MKQTSFLRIAHIEDNTSLLGPYNRFAIWVHGCCFNCNGCLAVNANTGEGTTVSVDSLCTRILNSNCEGITISGGEPFLQADTLLRLIQMCKEHRDIGVVVYSGFTLDEISKDKYKRSLLDVIDILIDGRYVRDLDDNRAYVGSSNQIIHYLSSRYINIGKVYYAAERRRAEIRLTETQAILIGVPSHNTLKIWQDIKEKCGGVNNDF